MLLVTVRNHHSNSVLTYYGMHMHTGSWVDKDMRFGYVVYADGLKTLAEIAGWLGRSADQAKYSAQAATLKKTINQLMFNGSAFCDGMCTAVHSIVVALSECC